MKINGIKEKLGANSAEEVVSMILGLMVVVVVIGLVVNFVQKKRGSIDVPGINTFDNLSLNGEESGAGGDDKDEGQYTVVAGDNLWKIAEVKLGNGYLWKDIATLNQIKNPEIIGVGQKLNMPQLKSGEETISGLALPSVKEGEDYVVVRGDHLWRLAVAAYGDGYRWVDIWHANKSTVANPSQIEIGMVLKIPRIEGLSVVE